MRTGPTRRRPDLRARFSRRAKAIAHKFEGPNYYATRAQSGSARLRAELQESAFWSRELYGASATIAYVVAGAVSWRPRARSPGRRRTG